MYIKELKELEERVNSLEKRIEILEGKLSESIDYQDIPRTYMPFSSHAGDELNVGLPVLQGTENCPICGPIERACEEDE